MLNEAEAFGVTREMAIGIGYQIEWDAALESLSKMHKRGIRILPGGDYGFAFTPHCETRATSSSSSSTWLHADGGHSLGHALRRQIMMKGRTSSALIKDGYLADLLLVDGDPLANLSILRDRSGCWP